MQEGQGCEVQADSGGVQDPQIGPILPQDQETPQQVALVHLSLFSNSKTASTMVSAWSYYNLFNYHSLLLSSYIHGVAINSLIHR